MKKKTNAYDCIWPIEEACYNRESILYKKKKKKKCFLDDESSFRATPGYEVYQARNDRLVRYYYEHILRRTYLALSGEPNYDVMGTSIGEIRSDTHYVVYLWDRGQRSTCFRTKEHRRVCLCCVLVEVGLRETNAFQVMFSGEILR